jgi:crotonobetainyl-CoA:carnitine CoA-transferase CaiB-like acyl-CoA transferase
MENESAPLSGYKVIVSGVHVMKARISALFSAWGADVIEIAARSTQGDGARFVPPLYGENDSYFFWAQNYGRRRIVALDLRKQDGREVAYRLLEDADVFATNLTSKVLKLSGVAWEDLEPRFPRLVGAYVSYAGHDGPDADRTGYHHTAMARLGIAMLASPAGPVLGAIPWIDHGTAGRLRELILVALLHRERTGKGCKVETSLLEYGAETLGYHAALAWTPRLAERVHVDGKQWDRHHTVPTLFMSRCADGSRPVVGAVMRAQVTKLLRALGLEHLLEDERFQTAEARTRNAHALLAIIHGKTRRMKGEELVELLEREGGVPVEAHRDIASVRDDPQLQARGMIWEVEGPDGLPMTVPGIAGQVGDHQPNRDCARRYAEDTAEVLRELGYSDDDMALLEKNEAIYRTS